MRVPRACWPVSDLNESTIWLTCMTELSGIALFEEISLFIGVGGLVLYMLFAIVFAVLCMLTCCILLLPYMYSFSKR